MLFIFIQMQVNEQRTALIEFRQRLINCRPDNGNDQASKVIQIKRLPGLSSPAKTPHSLGDLIGKEIPVNKFWQSGLLHECFTITNQDHAVQSTSLPERLKIETLFLSDHILAFLYSPPINIPSASGVSASEFLGVPYSIGVP